MMRRSLMFTMLFVMLMVVGLGGYAATASAEAVTTAAIGQADAPDGPPGRPGPGHPGRGPARGCPALLHYVHRACPCNGPDGEGWADHEEFVDCVTVALDEKLGDDAGERALECAARILERAESSPVGNPDFECPTKPARPGRPGPRLPGGPGAEF